MVNQNTKNNLKKYFQEINKNTHYNLNLEANYIALKATTRNALRLSELKNIIGDGFELRYIKILGKDFYNITW